MNTEKNHLAHVREATPKELRAAVKAHIGKTVTGGLLLDPDAISHYFATIATDKSYRI